MKSSDTNRRFRDSLPPATTSCSISARTYLPRSSPSCAARASAFATNSGGTRTVRTCVIRQRIHVRFGAGQESGRRESGRRRPVRRRQTGSCRISEVEATSSFSTGYVLVSAEDDTDARDTSQRDVGGHERAPVGTGCSRDEPIGRIANRQRQAAALDGPPQRDVLALARDHRRARWAVGSTWRVIRSRPRGV